MQNPTKHTNVIKLLTLIDEYDLFLFDIWGVVLESEVIYDQALDVVNQIIDKKNVMFVSNAPRTKESTYTRLKNHGFNVDRNMIMTAGELTKNILSSPQNYFGVTNPKIYNFGLEHHQELWQGFNLETTPNLEDADLMVISLNIMEKDLKPESYDLIKKAVELNIPALCSNNDRVATTPDGISYCAGHFAEQFEKFGGKVLYIGKPFEPIFQESLKNYPNIPKNRILMIGDTIDTDILGAHNIGIHSALVTTGNIGTSLLNCHTEKEKLLQIEKLCNQKNAHANHVITLVL
jgi:hypothetical protein